MGSLQAHEARTNRTTNQVEEKAFHIKGESSIKEVSNDEEEQYAIRGR